MPSTRITGATVRVVGLRKAQPISVNASGALLAEGARCNEEIHRLPTGGNTGIPEGGAFISHPRGG